MDCCLLFSAWPKPNAVCVSPAEPTQAVVAGLWLTAVSSLWPRNALSPSPTHQPLCCCPSCCAGAQPVLMVICPRCSLVALLLGFHGLSVFKLPYSPFCGPMIVDHTLSPLFLPLPGLLPGQCRAVLRICQALAKAPKAPPNSTWCSSPENQLP